MFVMFLLHVSGYRGLMGPFLSDPYAEECENLHLLAAQHVLRVKVSEPNLQLESGFCLLGLCDFGQVP